MSVCVMPSPKKRAEKDDRSGRNTAPIQVDKELAHMLAVVAVHDKKTQAEILTPIIEQSIRTHYERVQREIAEKVRKMKAEG